MVVVFCDRDGILLLRFIQPDTTINAAAYCSVHDDLHVAIWRKHSGHACELVFLLHNNVRAHSAARTEDHLRRFG